MAWFPFRRRGKAQPRGAKHSQGRALQRRRALHQILEDRRLLTGDVFEPNNSFQSATLLAAQPGAHYWSGLSIDTPGDVDWFKFTSAMPLSSAQYINTDSPSSPGTLSLDLYNSNDQLIAHSASTGADNVIHFPDLPAGTYYFEISGLNGATNPSYAFSLVLPGPDQYEPNNDISSATDFNSKFPDNNPLTGAWYVSNLSIDSPSDIDWFKFTTSTASAKGNYAKIDFKNWEGDLDLEVYDSNDNLLARSATANDTEQVDLGGLAAGTYYVKVFGNNGATNPNYTLSIDFPGPDNLEPNDSLATAHDFGTMNTTWRGYQWLSIDKPNDVDYFKFTTTETSLPGTYVQIQFSNAQGSLGLDLLDGSGKPIVSSNGVHDNQQVSLAGLPAGTYYAKVYGINGSTNPNYFIKVYTGGPDLAEPNDSLSAPYDFGHIEGHWSFDDLSIDPSGDRDWYRFVTAGAGVAGNSVAISFDHTQGPLDLTL